MLRTLIAVFFISFISSVCIAQNDVNGHWLVCETDEKCESDSPFLYMLIGDDSLAFITSMSSGLDPYVVGAMKYSFRNDSLIISDNDSNGNPSLTVFSVSWFDKNHFKINSGIDDYERHLYREDD